MVFEYRDNNNNLILRAEGVDKFHRKVTEVIDPNCKLDIGDIVAYYTEGERYLYKNYWGGRWINSPKNLDTVYNENKSMEYNLGFNDGKTGTRNCPYRFGSDERNDYWDGWKDSQNIQSSRINNVKQIKSSHLYPIDKVSRDKVSVFFKFIDALRHTPDFQVSYGTEYFEAVDFLPGFTYNGKYYDKITISIEYDIETNSIKTNDYEQVLEGTPQEQVRKFISNEPRIQKVIKELNNRGIIYNSLRRNNMIKSAYMSKDEIIEKLNNIYYEIYDIAKKERDESLYGALYDLGVMYDEKDLEEKGRELEWIVRNAGWSDKADLIHNMIKSSWKELSDDSDWDYGNPESYEVWDDNFGVSFKTTDKQKAEEFYNTHPESLYLIEYLEHGNRIIKSKENNMIKSVYTREDYDRFDEYGEYIPYTPTKEELAKKDEIKKVLSEELSDAYEPDPMDDYVGYDSTNERIDMACERVAKQFGVDTDFVEEIAGEVQKEEYARLMAENEWIYEHCNDKNKFWAWQNGEDVSLEELGIDKEQMDKEVNEIVHKYVNSSRQIKSSNIKSGFESRPIHSLPKFDREEFFKNRGKKRNDPYDEGYEAFSNGLSITDNPNKFKISTKYSMSDWDLWELGYKDAEKGTPKHNPVNSSLIKSSKYIVEVGDDSVEFDDIKEANETFRQAVENNDSNTTIKIYVDEGYSNKHLKLMDSERGRLNSSLIKSSYEDAFTVHPWDTNQVTGTSDEDLGLSYVVEAYGNEFVNVDDETLNDIRDKVLLRYFDDDAYVRDWNINYPDNQIESIYDIEDPEDLNNEELARYFDYEAYGRDLRLEHNMVWDSEEECWVSAHDVDDNELDNDKYIFMRG